MSTPQHVQEDSTGSILTYPPQWLQGVPSSVTVRVETAAQSMPDEGAAESATVDSVSAVTNAAALAGATVLSFAVDPSCTADRFYLFTDSTTGAKFRARCRLTGAALQLSEPLPMALGAASAIDGIAVTHALTTAETATAGRANTIVNATINGVDVEWFHQFRVVARQVNYTINAETLRNLEPDIERHQPAGDDDWSDVIQAAWDKFVYPDMARRGYRPERIVSWSLLEPWHASACLYHVIASNPNAEPDDKDRAKDMLHYHAENALQSIDTWYDASDSAGSDGPPETPRQLVGIVTR